MRAKKERGKNLLLNDEYRLPEAVEVADRELSMQRVNGWTLWLVRELRPSPRLETMR
jgi:hypothetical protein